MGLGVGSINIIGWLLPRFYEPLSFLTIDTTRGIRDAPAGGGPNLRVSTGEVAWCSASVGEVWESNSTSGLMAVVAPNLW